MEEKVLDYLKAKQIKLCVLATASQDAHPWCAVLGYAITDDLKFILSTHKGSKKYRNIQQNSQVSLLVGWEFKGLYIQCEGKVESIEGGDAFKESEEFFVGQNPHAAKFKSDSTIFLKVTPKFMRVTNFDITPPQIEEIELS